MAGTEHIKSVMVEKSRRVGYAKFCLSVPMWGSSMWGSEWNVLLPSTVRVNGIFAQYGYSARVCF